MTIFQKIINKEIKSDIVYEQEDIIVIKDINPKAKTHLLIIPTPLILFCIFWSVLRVL